MDDPTNSLSDFFDHAMRQFPSEKWVVIKRNFYDPSFPVGRLGQDLVVNQGIYVAPRLSEVSGYIFTYTLLTFTDKFYYSPSTEVAPGWPSTWTDAKRHSGQLIASIVWP